MCADHVMRIAGVDIGSKRGGSTVICYQREDGVLDFLRCARGKDPDDFLESYLTFAGIQVAFVDAPLSLPGVYCAPDRYHDYFFRICDRQLKGMSPMFLGGLTARAIRLKAHLETKGITLMETYPSGFFRLLFPDRKGYHREVKHLSVFTAEVVQHYGLMLAREPEDWHAFDAMLAWMSAWRWLHNQACVYGDPDEGVVYL